MTRGILSQLGDKLLDKNICKAAITINVIGEENVFYWIESHGKGF